MRIIRFIADDGRVLCGEDRGDGTADVLNDVQRVLTGGGDRGNDGVARLRDKHVVVAEDDDNMREIVCTVLTKAGCHCTACADGAEAMETIDHSSFDLVVSDIMMPHHNGYEIFSAARKRDAHMPVVLITGFGYDPGHALVKASEEGLDYVLYKPFTPQQLIHELCQAMDDVNGSIEHRLKRTGRTVSVASMLPPVEPRDIVCVGRNHRHADTDPSPPIDELEVFMKPTTSALATGGEILPPPFGGLDPQLDAEGELAIVLGRQAESVSEADALSYVLGYTAALDVTARRWQTPEGPPRWMRGKGFDTFCPLGPRLVTADEIADPGDLVVRTLVNGDVVREASTAMMNHTVAALVAELSRRITLARGTVILCGAPPRLPGATEQIHSGDSIAVEIEPIGRLTATVA